MDEIKQTFYSKSLTFFMLSFPPSSTFPTAKDKANKRTQINPVALRGDIVAHLHYYDTQDSTESCPLFVDGLSPGFYLVHCCQTAKYDPFLSLDCARVEGEGAQSKERKVSNFAA